MTTATMEEKWTAPVREKERSLRDGDATERALIKIVDAVILPALKRNYSASGLRGVGGVLFQGITQRGAKGNVVRVDGTKVSVSVDYGAIKYARYALEGRGPVHAKPGRYLRFVIDGRVIYAKKVRAAPPHDVYYLEPDDIRKAQEIALQELVNA